MSPAVASHHLLNPDQIADIHLAVSKMHGAERRAFQAEMVLKYCGGSARLGETIFGWGRQTITLGLAEKRTGILCLGAQSAFCGGKRWEVQHPEVAQALRELAEAHAQQDPTFNSTIAYTRLTAAAAIAQLKAQGFSQEQLPSPSTMAVVLNRMGYRLRKVVKAKPKKNSQKQTQSSRTLKPKTFQMNSAKSDV